MLLYGENLEVVNPQSLREQIRNIIKQQITYYSDEE